MNGMVCLFVCLFVWLVGWNGWLIDWLKKQKKSLEERTEILYIFFTYIRRQGNDPNQMITPIQFSASRARFASALHTLPPFIPTSQKAASHSLPETHASHSKCSSLFSPQISHSLTVSTPQQPPNRSPRESQEAHEWISWSRKCCYRCFDPNSRCSSCSASRDGSNSAVNARDTHSPQSQIALKAAKYPTNQWINAMNATQNAGFVMFWSRTLKQFWFL